MKRLAAICFLFTAYLFFAPFTVVALTKNDGDLYLEYSEPIFSSSEVWFPGKSLTKSVLVGNLSTGTIYQAGMKAAASDSSLLDVLSMTVRYGTATLWGPRSLRDLVAAGEILLTTIGPGGSVAYDLTASMDTGLGNDYQNKNANFDFVFGFVAPTLTATPAPGGGGGGGGGTGGSPPACDLTAPGPPQNLTVVPGGVGEVVLSWASASGTVTHYLVAYGPSSGSYLYGNPDVGGDTSYVVSSLSSGMTYYFVVKAVNDCAPGPFSNEALGVAGGKPGVLAATGPAAGFQVLGAKSASGQEGRLGGGTATSTARVAGANTTHFSWRWLLLLAFLMPIFWLIRRRNRK